jgi:hypothetical protein
VPPSGSVTITHHAATSDRPALEIRVSTRRVKSANAYWRTGVLVISLPAHLSVQQRQDFIDNLVERMMNKRRVHHGSDETLLARAMELAPKFIGEVRPTSVRFVTNQRNQWGSCSYDTGEIRITDRLKGAPHYVLDVVLIHELCHLVEPNHSEAFQALLVGMERRSEAEAFLAGIEHGAGLHYRQPGESLA